MELQTSLVEACLQVLFAYAELDYLAYLEPFVDRYHRFYLSAVCFGCGTDRFCYGDEENGHRACTSEHLTTANQSEIRKAYLVSVYMMGASGRRYICYK